MLGHLLAKGKLYEYPDASAIRKAITNMRGKQ
jgi:hypothetical protein